MKIKIEGMSCHHCKMAVEKALARIKGITSYTVNLDQGDAMIEGNPDPEFIIAEINKLGYRATLAE